MKSYFRSLLLLLAASLMACSAYSEDPNDENNQVSENQKFKTLTVAESIGIPWGMAWLPDGRMLVAEKSGTIHVIKNDKATGEKITGFPEVYTNNQGGLLDVQLHPNYAENGWLYFSYSKPGDGGGSTAILRAKLDGNRLTDQQVIFEASPNTRSGVHFGSRITFDKDNYLYFSIGDRGEMANAQSVANYYGKVHRIHDDGRIPEDNPFVRIPDAKHTIWSYGNRNIQGLKIHPVTGELWAHEHGPRGGDELNTIKKGKNYGWPTISYGINYDGSTITSETSREGMEQPIHYWVPSIAPCGLAIITSEKYPGWKGDMFIGSLSFRFLSRVVLDAQGRFVKEERLLENIGRVRNVAQSPDGYIYVAVEGKPGIIKLLPE